MHKRTKTSVLSANEPTGNTFALYVFTLVEGGVLLVAAFCSRLALGKLAVERFHLSGPELEVAHVCVLVATESDLGRAVGQHVQDLAVCKGVRQDQSHDEQARTGNVAELVIIEDRLSAFVAGHVANSVRVVGIRGLAAERETNASVIGLAYCSPIRESKRGRRGKCAHHCN